MIDPRGVGRAEPVREARRVAGAPAGHLDVPPLGRESLGEFRPDGVRAAVDEVAADGPDLDRRESRLRRRLRVEEDGRAAIFYVIAVRAALHDDLRRRGIPDDRARRKERHRLARLGRVFARIERREIERDRVREMDRSRERKRFRLREDDRVRERNRVGRRVEKRSALVNVERRELHRLRAFAHVERAARMDRHGSGLRRNRHMVVLRRGGRVHHHRAAENLHAPVEALVRVVVRERESPRAVLEKFRIGVPSRHGRIYRYVARLVRDDDAVRHP